MEQKTFDRDAKLSNLISYDVISGEVIPLFVCNIHQTNHEHRHPSLPRTLSQLHYKAYRYLLYESHGFDQATQDNDHSHIRIEERHGKHTSGQQQQQMSMVFNPDRPRGERRPISLRFNFSFLGTVH